jgi:hypothetical protein
MKLLTMVPQKQLESGGRIAIPTIPEWNNKSKATVLNSLTSVHFVGATVANS